MNLLRLFLAGSEFTGERLDIFRRHKRITTPLLIIITIGAFSYLLTKRGTVSNWIALTATVSASAGELVHEIIETIREENYLSLRVKESQARRAQSRSTEQELSNFSKILEATKRG